MIRKTSALSLHLTPDKIDEMVGPERNMLTLEALLTFDEFMERSLDLTQEIESSIVDQLILLIRRFNREDEMNNVPVEDRLPIKVYVDSPGGDIFSAMCLAECIKKSKTPVHTICTGIAMSGGAVVLMAGHKRTCYENAVGLIHKGSIGFQGNTSDGQELMKFYEIYQDVYYKNFIVDCMNITAEVYDEHSRKEWFLTSADMLKYGMVDGFIEAGEVC